MVLAAGAADTAQNGRRSEGGGGTADWCAN